MSSDEAVMSTNDDATTCKRSAVNMGYFEDPFVNQFAHGHIQRKSPEINRGYFARVAAVDCLIQQFLETVKKDGPDILCQIVNLGCGFDTLYWRLKIMHKVNHIKTLVDLDLDGITVKKVHIIRHKSNLLSVLGDDIKFSSTELHSIHYHLIAGDLRSLQKSGSSDVLANKLFNDCGLDKSLPTLFISECVLVYLHSHESHELLNWISSNFDNCVLINYEQVNMRDRFGEVMLENLHLRGCDLLGIDDCTDLKSQEDRFLTNGWTSATAWDMDTIYKQYLPYAEIERIEKLEFLDEKDLLEQLLQHYAIVIASKSTRKDYFNEISFDS